MYFHLARREKQIESMSLGKKSTDVDLKYKRRIEGGRVGRLGARTLGHCLGSHPSFPTPQQNHFGHIF